MYIHTVASAAIVFSVYFHDIPHPNIKGSSHIDASWIQSYIDFIQHQPLSKTSCLTVQFCLLGLFYNVRKHAEGCFTAELENSERKILHGPCGKIQVQGVTEIPVIYSWIIQVWKRYIINSTIDKLDIPYETLNCTNNYLRLYDNTSLVRNDLAKVCGRAYGKTFYSRNSSVYITLNMKYVKSDIDVILLIIYQVHRKSRVLGNKLHPKDPNSGREKSILHGVIPYQGTLRTLRTTDVQLVTATINNIHLFVFYFNTYIWNQVSITVQPICRVLVYDGPNSRSKLLGDTTMNNSVAKTFNSSLSIISVYSIKGPCAALSLSVTRQPTREYLHKIPSTKSLPMQLMYAAESENILKEFKLLASVGEFLNIKMSKFVYTGNTEAGCYLGGIVILPLYKPPIGPLCGEVGRLIFEERRLNGLTLGSHEADIIIFLYSGDNSKVLLDVIFSSDKCEGIPNPREYVSRIYSEHVSIGGNMMGRYRGTYVEITGLYNHVTDIQEVNLHLSREPQTCIKVQNIFDTIFTNTNVTRTRNARPEAASYSYRVDIKMVSNAVACSASKPYRIYSKNGDMNYTTVLSPPKVSFKTESFVSLGKFLSINTFYEPDCAPMFDGVSEVTLQLVGKNCFEFEERNEHLHSLAETSDTKLCSSLPIPLSQVRGINTLSWDENKQLTLCVTFIPNLHPCARREIHIVIFSSSNGFSYAWEIKKDKFQWTLWEPQTDNNVVHYMIVDLSTPTCNPLVQIEQHVDELQYDARIVRMPKSSDGNNKECLLHTCYIFYKWTTTSWSSAQSFCQKLNQQLLTINSHIKARFVTSLLYKKLDLDDNKGPMLFLNMKRVKVSAAFYIL